MRRSSRRCLIEFSTDKDDDERLKTYILQRIPPMLKKELERDPEFMGMNLGHDGDGDSARDPLPKPQPKP